MKRKLLYLFLVLFFSVLLFENQAGNEISLFFTKDRESTVPVYRFFNHVRGGHLYTISAIERDYIIDNLPEWNFEGTKFKVYEYHVEDTAATYRFFNTITGIHLYTISDIERDFIINNLPEFNYEGVKFFVSETLAFNTTAVYRFFNHVRGGHLYTISEIERDVVMQLPEWTYEGIPFYVYPLDAPLPKTGQTESFRTGDDGYYQMGVAWPEPRFTDHGDGTVTDNLSGLMWTKNANMSGKNTWYEAIDWCNALDHAGYSDWRLPNVREMHSLIDKGNVDPGLPEGHPFTNVQSTAYWSSTTFADDPTHGWYMSFGRGATMPWTKNIKSYYVWAVRGISDGNAPVQKTGQTVSYRTGDDGFYQMGIPWPEQRFIDHGDGTVTDKLTGLMWAKNADIDGWKYWNDAIDLCNTLNHAGYTDWRLPNVLELFSLISLAGYEPALPESHPFINLQNYTYWASTTHATDEVYKWSVGLHNGHIDTSWKWHSHYVLLVRGGQ